MLRSPRPFSEIALWTSLLVEAGIKQVESKKEEKAAAEEERAHKKQEIKDQILGDQEVELGMGPSTFMYTLIHFYHTKCVNCWPLRG